MKCRHCDAELVNTFVDLGSAPPSNSYLTRQTLLEPEKWYPLKVLVCDQCWLVQTEDFLSKNELFSADYAYFSSYSSSWVEHARTFTEEIISRLHLNNKHMVVEIAANDGYLLQHFQERGVPCYGVEPTKSTAAAARQKNIPVVEEFFGSALAYELRQKKPPADLIIANNVLAHVPDVNDFVKGFSILLAENGVATFEFPHLLQLVQNHQFDTIYHEHYSYFSLVAASAILNANGLAVFDVEELPTHGGSLRLFTQPSGTGARPVSGRFRHLQEIEHAAGITNVGFYQGFQATAEKNKFDFLRFLLEARQKNKKIAAYGAAAKGNTLLNFAGIRQDLVDYVVDQNPAKQGKYMPGSRIPIVNEEHLQKNKPDYVVILPWNLRAEITEHLAYTSDWGGRLVTAIPQMTIT